MFYVDSYVKSQATTILIIASIVSLIMAVIFGFASRSIVRGKGYPDQMNHGFLWGFFLGLIGLIVCACKQPYNSQPFNGQPPYGGQPYNGQPPYGGQPYNGQPNGGQPYSGQPPYGAQPYGGQPYNAQPAADSWQCSCGTVNGANEAVCHVCGAPRHSGQS